MLNELKIWEQQLSRILAEFQEQAKLKSGQLLIVGCSTSEVAGQRIGTSGTFEIAEMIFRGIQKFAEQTGIHVAFQCCEHLNRALVVEHDVLEKYQLEEVAVIPVRTAGGAMATYAFEHFQQPVVVEFIQADAGIDIGDTFIGMHLKHVAVPVRVREPLIGNAHVTLAKTRPKLIGGSRAVYEKNRINDHCS
ncbi:uncharacterized protein (TIGR01440 family) [Oikeobacillus pervagus]|uniref:UPF0340 protein J2S13_000540 n=1 Tax=Oikeobacillus pervagus TaxID=1325931 RepID=A0AAJ1SX07_9BACI|nr:TIGR01440 family protein [Oikeobacillus pervagus]MDQ0214144.1 uncharacterized protein (TIGR01440 family) [Oikeobacillus pervagus]